MRTPTFEIFRGQDGQNYFRLIAANGRTILASEGYSTRGACEQGVRAVQENATGRRQVQAAHDERRQVLLRSDRREQRGYRHQPTVFAQAGSGPGPGGCQEDRPHCPGHIRGGRRCAFAPTSQTIPSFVASPIVPGVATDFAAATDFLYTGSNPIQTWCDRRNLRCRSVSRCRAGSVH